MKTSLKHNQREREHDLEKDHHKTLNKNKQQDKRGIRRQWKVRE